MSFLKERAYSALNTNWFASCCSPESLGKLELTPPIEEQKVLRILIEEPFSGIQLPEQYHWTMPMILRAKEGQARIGIKHPFMYLTIRHGLTDYVKDDAWHTDGFSMRFTHLPEQNYIWVKGTPTEYVNQRIEIPSDFDPMVHNLHLYLQEVVSAPIQRIAEGVVYVMDPYVIHRRPPNTFGEWRTFVRVSFTPIEIIDKNNDQNPMIPRNYNRDGLEDFRDRLIKYDVY